MPLQAGSAYFWGCVGGFAAGVVVYLLPPLAYAWQTGDYERLTWKWVGLTVALLLILTALSGVGPLIVGKVASSGMAIKIGIGAQGAIKGLAASGREATGR